MPISLQQFVQHLADSGLMSDEEILDAQADVPPEKLTPDDAQPFAKELVKQRKLTPFQATAIYQGKSNGLSFGNYVVQDKLGQGGMGMVFKAQHRRMQRVVALKVMSAAGMKSPDAVKRFRREVQAAAKLTHPNIVAAFDADEAKGTHFLVMEYVEGDDLAKLVKKHGPLPVDRAINYVIQAARGLEHAHNEGVVHRDIKPANLLLDKHGTVKILDMGLARIDDNVGANATGLTQTGNIMGTVDYMSPEQALNTKYADKRADIYSLGCSLWYLLTGKSVYTGESLMERLMAHREQPIPSLSGSISLDKTPEDSRSLDAVFARMIAKRPEERYQTMGEAIRDLEAVLAGGQVAASTSASWGAGNPLGLGGAGGSGISGEQDSALREFLQAIDPNAPGSGVRSRTRPASETLVSKAGEKTQISVLQNSLQKIAKLPPKVRWGVAGGGGGALVLLLLVLVFSGGGDKPDRSDAPAPATAAKQTGAADKTGANQKEGDDAAVPAPGGQFAAAAKTLFTNDLEGWRALPQYWSVSNGSLTGSSLQSPVKFNTFVCSPRKYRDFELEFQVRLKDGAGNSGVQIRSSIIDEQQLILAGPQVEIAAQFPGSLYGEKFGSGWMKQGPASLDAVVRAGDFNDYFIRCVGSRLLVKVNGRVALDEDIPGMPEDGYIGWQLHGRNPMEVTFRNMQLRELTGNGTSNNQQDTEWISLFNGNDLTGWKGFEGGSAGWKVEDGCIVTVSGTGGICTTREYGPDYELHVEFWLPRAEDVTGEFGANSGIYLNGRYEIEIVDNSQHADLAPNGVCGALCGALSPKPGASRPAETWQTFDITFRSPRFDASGRATAPGRLTLVHNGVKVIDDQPFDDFEGGGAINTSHRSNGPIYLQELATQGIKFRNIRLRPLGSGMPPGRSNAADWISLFNGRNMDGWQSVDQSKQGWQVKDGCMEIVPNAGTIRTTAEYGPDYELHAEFWLPRIADKSGQQRANSGIFLNGRHEIQILDMYQNSGVQPIQGCGALYGVLAPKAGGIVPPETWQTFDITYNSPRYDGAGKVTAPGRLSVVHNGVKVIDDQPFSIAASMGATNTTGGDTGPIVLQVHQTPGIRFRNLRLRPLGATTAQVSPPARSAAGPAEPPALDFTPHGRVDVASFVYDGNKPLTIEAWIKHGKLTEDGVIAHVGPFVLKYHVPLGRYEMNAVDRNVAESVIRATLNEQLIEDRWLHIAGQWDGTTVQLFVDGQPQSKLVYKKTIQDVRASIRRWIGEMQDLFLTIGSNRPGIGEIKEQFFAGEIAALRVSSVVRYTRQFSPATDAPMQLPSDKDTVALYLFGDGTGARLTDSSGNNHHGRITGAIWTGGVSQTPAPASAGWVDLFNGKDLTGWQPQGYNGWSVKSAVLVGETNKAIGWLMSEQDYADFDLSLEYKLSFGSNSGVFLRAPTQGNVSGSEFTEVQILDDAAPQFGTIGALSKTGAVFKQIPADPPANAAANVWNQMAISVRGKRVTVTVNGTVTAEGEAPQLPDKSGRIGLQLYPSHVEFRNVRIRTIDR
jgi:serine/threonine protein kinase